MEPIPSIEQVEQLQEAMAREVGADWIDENGHMNILFFLDLNSRGADFLQRRAGIDDDYRTVRRLGTFTVEHHIRYYSELRLGEELAVHPRLVALSDKAMHLLVFCVDRTNQRLANTLEVTFVHVDLESRRATAFPDDVHSGLRAVLAEHTALEWPAPVCGAMGIRR